MKTLEYQVWNNKWFLYFIVFKTKKASRLLVSKCLRNYGSGKRRKVYKTK